MLKKLEVVPGDRTMKPGDELQLAVRAEFSDGNTRDVTWLTKFNSNDPGVADVDAFGKVRLLRNGETAIRAAFQTLVAVVVVTVPFERPVDPARLAGRNNFIDDHVFAKLGVLRIDPSDPCGDAEFLRRAFLDTIGVLPTPDETRASSPINDPTSAPVSLTSCWSDRSTSITGRCSWATCCRTARSATTTFAASKACGRSTNGSASRWRRIGRGTRSPAPC